MAREAIKDSGFALKYIPTDIPNYEQIALEAVKRNGYALECVPKEKITEEMAMEALKTYGYIPKYDEGISSESQSEYEDQSENARKTK